MFSWKRADAGLLACKASRLHLGLALLGFIQVLCCKNLDHLIANCNPHCREDKTLGAPINSIAPRNHVMSSGTQNMHSFISDNPRSAGHSFSSTSLGMAGCRHGLHEALPFCTTQITYGLKSMRAGA